MMAAQSQLAPDEAVIRQFVTNIVGADIHIAAIEPDGAIEGRYFGENEAAAVEMALKRNLAGRNIYWTANRCHPDAGTKPTKEEISSARFAHVDIDPPKDGSHFDKASVIRQLEACSLPPSGIVDSGNGVQALWRLADDTNDLERVEAINRAIAQRFGGDRPWPSVKNMACSKACNGLIGKLLTLKSEEPHRLCNGSGSSCLCQV